jgi:hypothetical protein
MFSKTTPNSNLFQNKLKLMSLSKVWNENERFKLVFTKLLHCKKNWSENKSLFRIPISPTVFSISVVQNLCTSPLSLFQITQVGKKTLTLLMETNSIPWSKKYFRCICLNSVGNALSVGRIFSMT